MAVKKFFIDKDGHYSTVDKFGVKQHVFDITHFKYDKTNRSFFFIKDRVNQQIPYSGGELKYNINKIYEERDGLLVGTKMAQPEFLIKD